MRKVSLFLLLLVSLPLFVGLYSCGPNAEEKARLDSIRIADSIRRADSIQIADSLKAVREAAEKELALRKKVDEVASSVKADFVVKMYDLHKVVYAKAGDIGTTKRVTIKNVETESEKVITLTSEYGPIMEIQNTEDGRHVVVEVHMGGTLPFFVYYTIDVDAEKVTKVRET